MIGTAISQKETHMTKSRYDESEIFEKLQRGYEAYRERRSAFLWQELGFGKYSELTLPEVILRDASYFCWGMAKPVFNRHVRQADIVAARAAHILPPPGRRKSKFVIERTEGGSLKRISIMHSERAARLPSRRFTVHGHLDLAIIEQFQKKHRFRASDTLTKFMTDTFFEVEDSELTKQLCERFFEDDDNFALCCSDDHSTLGED
jgi:hypothetical protein